MDNEVIIRMRHLRSLGYCSRGTRAFCERYGLNFLDLTRAGISSKDISSIDDHRVQKLLEIAKGDK